MNDNLHANLWAINQVNWEQWEPTHRATAVFLIKESQVLLIRKKRGMGCGKICAPGGKVEPNETLEQCAIREVEEEVALKIANPIHCGTNFFHFTSGYQLVVDVYKSGDSQGQMQETEEALPFWVFLSHMPYKKMWADTFIWFPFLLRDQKFIGRYLFKDDTMLDFKLLD